MEYVKFWLSDNPENDQPEQANTAHQSRNKPNPPRRPARHSGLLHRVRINDEAFLTRPPRRIIWRSCISHGYRIIARRSIHLVEERYSLPEQFWLTQRTSHVLLLHQNLVVAIKLPLNLFTNFPFTPELASTWQERSSRRPGMDYESRNSLKPESICSVIFRKHAVAKAAAINASNSNHGKC